VTTRTQRARPRKGVRKGARPRGGRKANVGDVNPRIAMPRMQFELRVRARAKARVNKKRAVPLLPQRLMTVMANQKMTMIMEAAPC